MYLTIWWVGSDFVGNSGTGLSVCLVQLLRELILSELILDKSELNIEWFMFECIYVKVDLLINLKLKSFVEVRSYKL